MRTVIQPDISNRDSGGGCGGELELRQARRAACPATAGRGDGRTRRGPAMRRGPALIITCFRGRVLARHITSPCRGGATGGKVCRTSRCQTPQHQLSDAPLQQAFHVQESSRQAHTNAYAACGGVPSTWAVEQVRRRTVDCVSLIYVIATWSRVRSRHAELTSVSPGRSLWRCNLRETLMVQRSWGWDGKSRCRSPTMCRARMLFMIRSPES